MIYFLVYPKLKLFISDCRTVFNLVLQIENLTNKKDTNIRSIIRRGSDTRKINSVFNKYSSGSNGNEAC